MTRRTFNEWLAVVDRAILAATDGIIGLDDLPDADYHGWYDDGMSAGSAAKRAMRDAGAY